MAYTTATLTGTYHTTDGQPAVGTVEIAPNSRILIDTDGDVVLSGAITVTLDESGSFAIVLPSTDDATVEPATGRQYRVEVNLQHRHFPPVRIELAAGETVDMADVTSVTETAAAVAVWLTQEEYDAVVDRVSALEAAPGGVTTVNGESGAVMLSASDVGAARKGPTLADYEGQMLFMAHRGGLGIYPEHTLEAFRAAMAEGVNCLEMDTAPLADGTAALLHDTTIDRVMSGTGSPAKFTAGTWQSQVVDCSTWFSPAWKDSRGVTFEEVAREFGGKTILAVEAKVDARTGSNITQIIKRYGIEDSTIVWTFYTQFLEGADNAIAEGLTCGFIDPDGSTDPATLPGYSWYMVDKAQCSDVRASELVASGMKVVVYTVNRHNELDRYAALGVAGVITDEPVYLERDTSRYIQTDPYITGTYYNGQLSNVLDRGSFSAGKLSTGTLGGKTFILQGWMYPWLAPRYQGFVLDATLTFDAIGSSTGNWLGVAFGQSVDSVYSNAADANNDGYLLMLRANGTFNLYREDNGLSTLLGTQTTAALAAGGTATVRIEVTATGVTIRRTDGTPVAITTTDIAHRGPYVYFGRNDSGSAGLRGSFSSAGLST